MEKGNNYRWEREIVDRLTQFLKPLGYRKSGLRWQLREGSMAYQFWLQKSASTNRDHLRFHINVSVGSLAIAEREPPGPVWARGGQRFHWGTRLENLMPRSLRQQGDWRIESDTECQEMGDVLVRAIQECAFPAMEEVNSEEKLLADFQRELPHYKNDESHPGYWQLLEAIRIAEEIIGERRQKA